MFSRMTITILTAFLCYINCFAQDNSKAISEVDFTARDINGKKIQLKKLLANGPVLLDFWALWCVPCLKEMPELKKIARKYQEQGLTVVAINEDSPSDQSKVKPYVKQKRYDFIVVVDENNRLLDQFNVNALPTTILIDQSGAILYVHTGFKSGDEKQLIKEVDTLFATGNKKQNQNEN